MIQGISYDKLTAWAQHDLLPAQCGYERIELGVSCKYMYVLYMQAYRTVALLSQSKEKLH